VGVVSVGGQFGRYKQSQKIASAVLSPIRRQEVIFVNAAQWPRAKRHQGVPGCEKKQPRCDDQGAGSDPADQAI